MKRASRAPGLIGAAVLVLVVAFALLLDTSPRAGSKVAGSIGSAGDDGRRALALLLGRVGIRAEGWRQVPAALPRGGHAVWIAGHARTEETHESPGEKRRTRLGPAPLPKVGMHAPEHYADFVSAGGTLIVEGVAGLEFLRDALELEGAQGLVITTLDGDETRSVRLDSGELLRADVGLAFEPLDPGSVAREIAVVVDEQGIADLALAVEIPVGSGRAIAIADGRPFANDAIGEQDHALLAVRVAEEAPPGARVLLDEYALGLWKAEGPLSVATRPSLALLSAHLLALGLLWTWMRAAPRAFPRDPEPLESFSPVLRARARARLFERAGRVGLLVEPARSAAFDRIAARRRSRARRESESPSEADVARLADDVGRAGGPELAARAKDLLSARDAERVGRTTRSELERFVRELARLEDDVRAIEPEGRGDRGRELRR